MSVKLLTEHHPEFLSLKGGGTGSSESSHFKMPHCWKSHVVAQFVLVFLYKWVLPYRHILYSLDVWNIKEGSGLYE